MAFFSDSLGHGAFTGLALGAILGIFSPTMSLILFSVVFALLITWIKNNSTASTDTIIGVFSSVGIAAGLMMMSYGGGFNKYSSYLIGDILSITQEEIQSLGLVLVVVLLAWGWIFNRLLILSVNASFFMCSGSLRFDTERSRRICVNSQAMVNTYLPNRFLLRFISLLTVDTEHPICRAITVNVFFSCNPR